VRFGDFLKATVLLSAGAATALAAISVIGISQQADGQLIAVSVGWWILAALIGLVLGRRAETSPPIARLLAGARAQTTLPELNPARTLLNRLWPLLISTLGAGVLAVFEPQVASIATGFAIIWALAWRRQEAAVAAIEERDGVRFYIDRTSPLSPIQLIRTPGFGGTFLPQT
jgi:hydrogenase-4 membrane subunit HyfE